jgi:hypothetical protein
MSREKVPVGGFLKVVQPTQKAGTSSENAMTMYDLTNATLIWRRIGVEVSRQSGTG